MFGCFKGCSIAHQFFYISKIINLGVENSINAIILFCKRVMINDYFLFFYIIKKVIF